MIIEGSIAFVEVLEVLGFAVLYCGLITISGLFLLRFANHMHTTLDDRQVSTLTKGFQQLAKWFAFMGILGIVWMARMLIPAIAF